MSKRIYYGPRADRQPSFVSLVLDELKRADDFLTLAQLHDRVPELNVNRSTASLAHLRKFRAADFIVSDGITYWYATGEDTRTRTTEERVREAEGSRARGSAPGSRRKAPKPPAGEVKP